jgi:LEA14-like dessication related protein
MPTTLNHGKIKMDTKSFVDLLSIACKLCLSLPVDDFDIVDGVVLAVTSDCKTISVKPESNGYYVVSVRTSKPGRTTVVSKNLNKVLSEL